MFRGFLYARKGPKKVPIILHTQIFWGRFKIPQEHDRIQVEGTQIRFVKIPLHIRNTRKCNFLCSWWVLFWLLSRSFCAEINLPEICYGKCPSRFIIPQEPKSRNNKWNIRYGFYIKTCYSSSIFNTYMVIFLIFKFCSKVVISVMK